MALDTRHLALVMVVCSSLGCGPQGSEGDGDSEGDGAGGGVKPDYDHTETYGQRIARLSDGRYVIGGQKAFVLDAGSGLTDFDMLLQFRDSQFEPQSEMVLGGPGYDYISAITPTSDGGLLVCGAKGGDPDVMGSNADAAFFHLGPDNEILVERYIGWEGSDNCLAVRQTAEGYQMLFVTKGSEQADRQEGLYLLTLDAVGAVVADEFKKARAGITYRSASFTADGGWILVGVHTYGGSEEMLVIQRVDGDGKTLFDRNSSDSSFDVTPKSMVVEDDGSIVFTGAKRTKLVNTKTPMFIEMWDATGEKIWSQEFEGDNNATGHVLIRTADGGLLAGGTANYGKNEGLLVKVNSSGDHLWTSREAQEDMAIVSDLIESPTGVFIVGTTYSKAPGMKLWAELKTDLPE